VVGVPLGMNELIVLEQIHLFVEALDGYFNSGECIEYYVLIRVCFDSTTFVFTGPLDFSPLLFDCCWLSKN